MVKSIVSVLVVFAILICGAVYETDFVQRQFNEFSVVLEQLYLKTDNHTATEDDVLSAQKNWLEKKKYLHVFIPHNEIKEMDLWISEAIILVRDEEWTDAVSKIEVLIDLTEQIPKTFRLSFENVM